MNRTHWELCSRIPSAPDGVSEWVPFLHHLRASHIRRIGMYPRRAVGAGEQAGCLRVAGDRAGTGVVDDPPAKLLGKIGKLAACAGYMPLLDV